MVYPVNQYRAIVVTTDQIVSLNTRAGSLTESIHTCNITKVKASMPTRLVAATRNERIVLLLLSTGELAIYADGRILSVQALSHVRGELSLEPF